MANKISIIIPNYNGQHLLRQNLPKVIATSPGCEIIVVDDASSDNSVKLIHKKFKKIKVIKLKHNKGFANAVNTGAAAASGVYICLLNSDVSPRKNYLKTALAHFKRDKFTFAVGFLDFSHESGKVLLRGRGKIFFKNGFVMHSAAPIERGKTDWVSGGSSLVDRKKFLELKGLDTNFAPFYWEDIDVCFRAAKVGYNCYFEPLSIVDHFHEKGAIATQKSASFVKTVSYKNQFLFFWKNISDFSLCLQHLVYLPYHLIRALIKLELPFLAGLIWALAQQPNVIINSFNTLYVKKLLDKEVLK